jgi:hypothetical protein
MLRCVYRSGTVYRGKIDFLTHVVRVIFHASAIYLTVKPHREFLPIWRYSVRVVRPEVRAIEEEDESDGDEDGDNINNDPIVVEQNDAQERNVGDWDHIDTGNVFGAFELHDDCMAWYDDNFYIASIVEIDETNQQYTVLFRDDQLEVRAYKACWIKHFE